MRHILLAAIAAAALAVPASAAITFAGKIDVAGNATDLATLGNGPNLNRLSFGSDLIYNPGNNTFYGISDRGPGGGTIDWAPRVEAFKVDVAANGAISNFQLTQTTVFKQANGQVFSGLLPSLLPGGAGVLGNALDSEGIVRLKNGHFLVSDEYGPSIYETKADGTFIRAFTQPANVLPKVGGNPDFANAVNTGRQDNRGYEGLTINADGTKAWAILQDPLQEDGTGTNPGRRSPNLRIVEFDMATGQPTAQYAYQLESLASINARIPGTAEDFGATAQGRNIGASSITWIGGTSFLVIERDNRGQGPDNLLAGPLATVGSKRIYLIDIAGATDVSAISFAGSNALPGGVTPVSKTLFLDVQAALVAAGEIIPEKFEGLAIGPRLAGGGFAIMLATDNDFSVTQNGSFVQFDVCTGGGTTTQITLGDACPDGQALVPSRLYSFAVTGADAALFDASLVAVPEPASWAMLIAGFGLTGAALRRRRAVVA